MNKKLRGLVWLLLFGLIPLSAGAGSKWSISIRNHSVSFWRTADLEEAKKEAAAAHKPIAWIASAERNLDNSNAIAGSNGRDATLHALFALRDRTVLIFEDAYAENHKVLQLVDQALHTPDPHYTPPVVVFLNSDATKVLAKVPYEPDFKKRAQALAGALDACKGQP